MSITLLIRLEYGLLTLTATLVIDGEYTERYIAGVKPRDRLIDVAMDLFVGRGYDAVGVQEIVEQAGLTKPTLYHHFGNKRGLLDVLAGRVEEGLFAALCGSTTYGGDLPRDLEAFIGALLAFARACPRETRLLLAAQNGPVRSETRQALGHVWARLSGELEGFFASAARDHGNMLGRQGEYTVSLLGVVFAYAVLMLDGRVDEDSQRPREIMRQFSYGIYS